MTLQSRLTDLATAIATDMKLVRTEISGSSTGDLSGLTTNSKTSLVSAINEVKTNATGAPPAATGTTAGVAKIADQPTVNTGTDDATIVSPLKFQTRLAAYAQPLSANLTSLAGVVSGSFGRTLLQATDKPTAQQALGLSAVALSGSASDITTGILPASVIPNLAINDTFTVATQAAMLALTAQRGDMALRTDLNGKFFVLITDDPTTLANWKPIVASSDVSSVAGRTGAIVLTSADVGLDQVNNTSDANKPVSSATQTALNLRLLASNNLSDVAAPATALTNIGGVATTAVGNTETDLVAAYNTAKQ